MLLARLGLPFSCAAPDIDETPRPAEAAADLVSRLAKEKAHTIAAKRAGATVIGADQVAVFDGRTIGKPGNRDKAAAQLAAFSGRRLDFLTCVAVVCPDRGYSAQYTDTTRVFFRRLETAEIDRYLSAEQPYDCAGSFKSEALGISLFERVQNEDPSAIVGLPLIETAKMLRQAGFRLP